MGSRCSSVMIGPRTITTCSSRTTPVVGWAGGRLPEASRAWPGSTSWSPATSTTRLRWSIATETDRGLFVGALVAAGYTVLAVNPMSTSRYRERHSTSGAKSDPGDAKVLADLARTDAHNHRRSPVTASWPRRSRCSPGPISR